ncbi:dUTP diphosphatase [Thermosyntropha sp.]|uniref:dUTP diphosphatase n=1 Tax=Thermosyntropha sp. TaxID=2740820 RepID=UPI0025E9607D|nr:dUTP diphosphatase [Thermosyntropha sp.]MBO8158493.1 dUTP diphosphatase [Thermosyntropha sp.]
MEKVNVQFKKLVEWARIPEYETKNAAGCDISLAITEEVVLYPNEVKSFPTGFAIRIPEGYEAQIRSRAGMARKGIVVANAPGTIDAEHTDEIHILLLNVNDKPVKIFPGQKVAQMVISPVVQANFVQR